MEAKPAGRARTIGALWRDAAARGGPAFQRQTREGWEEVGWDEAAGRVDALAAGFLAADVSAGEPVALLARTRMEWTLCDLALASIGAVLVPIYPTASAEEVRFIVEHCGVRMLIAETARDVRRLGDGPAAQIVLMEGDGEGTLAELERRGAAANLEEQVAARSAEVSEADVLTYLYTSGTTGTPKACVLTHRNFTAMTEAVRALHVVGPGDSLLLFLPLAHNFARLMQYTAVSEGVPIIYCRDFIAVPKALTATRPTVVPGVPRFYEQVAAQVRSGIERLDPARRAAARWALRTAAAERAPGHRPGPLGRAKLAAADRMALAKVRERMGGRVRIGVSGGAPLPADVAELFQAAGVTVVEGYGLSEATCASHFNRPENPRPGTVGPPLPGIEARLDEGGEVLLRGETVFAGYLGDPEATAEVLTPDGWLRTGDIGEIDQDGFLRIVDRKKDLIVTSGGKNIAPQKLEGALRADPLISEALVVGDRRPYLVALIAPDLGEVRRLDLPRDELERRIGEAVARVNARVGKTERIARHAVLDRQFSQEHGEVTATLKLRRRTCADRFSATIDELYAARA
ncbi:MAG TPA: long-chain fatty acid--CoA ligase [Gaiellales bacterium]|nr:long-chain fatty acid--CoA ligase [Gaiellales bacterium]